MKSTFNVSFFIKRKDKDKEGFCPLEAKISIDSESAYFRPKVKVKESSWIVAANRTTGKSDKLKETNLLLDGIVNSLTNIYNHLLLKDNYVTPEKVKNRFLGLDVKEEQNTLLQLYHRYNCSLKEVIGNRLTEDTYKKYVRVYKYLEAYLKIKCNVDNKCIREIDLEFIQGFDRFLRTERKCKNNIHGLKRL